MRFLSAGLLSLISLQGFAKNPTYNYGPKKVELSGTLGLQNFPGLPNYENIAEGDEIERHFYLRLDSPIDVIPTDNDEVQDAKIERNVKIVQMAPDYGLLKRLRETGKGTHVIVTGHLFHRFTGHHHARVLVDVEGFSK